MKFRPDRLIQLRTSMNISKAEAARQLNISAMTYGRYEKGEREPSYPSVSYIAQIFHCNIDFLYGTSDLVALGKKWKLLAEKKPKIVPLSRIEKKRIAKSKKAKKEILEFFS